MLISLLQAPYNWTVIVSLVFALLPLVLGSVVLRTVRAENWESKRSTKVTLVVVGLLAPFVWAGFYVGPLLVILAGLVPLVRQ
jgi:chromate transport protein ChrA